MPITYKELAEKILSMPIERQNDHVTVSCDLAQEVHPAQYLHQILDDDWALGILDKGHLVIAVHA